MMEMAGRLRGLTPDAARAHATDWLVRVGPRGSEQKRIAQLSGGQKQLVAIGCALAGNPSLLLLDEAYAGLDAAVMRRADEAILAYRNAGGSVLMTSHQLDHVHRISDRVVVLHHGTVAASWQRAELDAAVPATFPTLSDLYLSVVGERDADS
jgi:ABC-type multidrug transport system ATPase subunit